MDTIFALATAPGKAGIAIVRVSGERALATLAALRVAPPPPRVATLAPLRLEDGSALDRAIVLYFPAPASFTGEDCVEYHLHGGRAIVKRLFEALTALPGLRPAEPGEFTRRAFLNGKMDLTAAEGLADIIDAETEGQRRQAYRIMQGESARFYATMREEIITSLALYEAYIDFPEEDISEAVLRETGEKVLRLCDAIASQLSQKAAERVRDGVRVAIIGPPNAGKSSLMNRLAQREVAIVSEVAGTTRDVIEVHMDIGGYAVTVSDTAGLREAHDAIEQEGINRSLKQAEEADIRIFILDTNPAEIGTGREGELLELMRARDLVFMNKCDRGPVCSPILPHGLAAHALSVKSGVGIDTMLKMLSQNVEVITQSEAVFVTRERHRHHLREALDHLRSYLSLDTQMLEIQCEELRRAALEIGKITGIILTDDLLDVIFSRFCIGK